MNTVRFMNYCPPGHRCIRTFPPTLFVQKWMQTVRGCLGVLPQKILNLVDVISCILVHFGDGQLEKGNT